MYRTDYNTWVCHFHVGKNKLPLTVYRMHDEKDVHAPAKYELAFGKQRRQLLDRAELEQWFGKLLLAAAERGDMRITL